LIDKLFRATEDFEYSELLDQAAKCKDIAEQMALVAAFTVSAYSTTSERVAKPFNPMLGETYECDRMTEKGWRYISEQVSHHPPILAQHCESKNWKCSTEFQLTSKFRGKHIEALPMGLFRVEFPVTGTSYTYNRPVTSCHNLIIGKLYVEHSGEVSIIGEKAAKGWKCHLNYVTHSFFTKDTRLVKGLVMDPADNVKNILNGQWDDSFEAQAVPSDGSTGTSKVIWRKRQPPSDSELYYNFTIFVSQLNEMEAGIAPTDSRLRPDQRLMENGDWDASNREKLRLEEQQREKRRRGEDVKPLWFAAERDEETGLTVHKYKGNYWPCKAKQDWSKCPSIF